MKLRELAALATILAVGAEIVFPGRDVYHTGWYNLLVVAIAAIAIVPAPKGASRASGRQRYAIAAIAAGAAVAAIAGVASGLLAPDNGRVVGAPGERVRSSDVGGTFVFPFVSASAQTGDTLPVALERGGHTVEIGDRPTNVGTFVLHAQPRTVVYVEARDARGGTLTVTQPNGSAFLSPVLLMQQRQTIAGLDLPFDSFAVPAAHRVVKAVLFTGPQAAQMRGMGGANIPAVLFAAEDEQGRPLPHGLALDPDGATIVLAGLRLRATVLPYPAIDYVAVPQLEVTLLGALLVVGGLVAARLKERGAPESAG